MAPSATEDLNRAKERISQAISVGAPAYNAGEIELCAKVYREAAREIAPLVPPALRTKLLREMEEGENGARGDSANFDAKAWALRRAFDSIIDYRPPFVPRDVTEEENVAFEPFTKTQLGGEPAGVMDGVMGGISSGGWMSKSNTFFGETSLANNGGFASLRWRFPNAQNWSHARGIYVKGLKHSRAEEHTFRIILKDASCERVRLANYKATFANPERTDRPLLIPFSAFDQMEQMGRAMVGSPALNPMHVTEIGLMAIKPTVVGEFQLEFLEWGLYL
eukprot:CAMPEP_0172531540 /NCGR_PEP_ID=MMETSP1067-20121228/4907_1 /TAXON_ID=265564 ORGANISM="Thalassiosira punctigera, Strain Tpunct2005C2" /NCGR_SAMPLE_ID=MMETSP1067 /ASSEMBLY_ACC=CAM_ASM_000444 /LENGTH=277 /DNA_ID=CAMNT_0013315931 /DNA_START=179 /DNA_END=1012 /DNA_ORIENTATION=+